MMTPEEGLRTARAVQLDLVEIAPTAAPPVCRIMDYSKYKYEQEKKAREARKKQKIVHLKEVKFRPNIEQHDYQVKLNQLKKFLERGDKAKITLWFKGRQMAHKDQGRELLDRVIRDLSDAGEVEEGPTFEGRYMVMIMKSK